MYSMRLHVFFLFSGHCEIATDSNDIMSEEPSSLVYSIVTVCLKMFLGSGYNEIETTLTIQYSWSC